jgi:hypothetical protein
MRPRGGPAAARRPGVVSLAVLGCVLSAGSIALAQQRAPAPRVTLELNGGYRASTVNFRDEATPTINAEAGRITASYDVPRSPGLDLGGAVRVWKQLGVGLNFARSNRSVSTDITASLPHPFVFGRPRSIEGVASNDRSESTLAIQARYGAALTRRLAITVFGGPAWIALKQSMVENVNYAESYPYDTAAYQSAVLTNVDRTVMGFAGGADATIYFSKQLGLGFGLKYSAGNVDLQSLEGGTVKSQVGGLDLATGLRFRF